MTSVPPSGSYTTPLLIGLFLVTTFAVLSVFVWMWAMRRPPAGLTEAPVEENQPEPPAPVTPVYVALGVQDVQSLLRTNSDTFENWPALLYGDLPAGTQLVKLGEQDRTLRETNEKSLPPAISAKPTMITFWQVVGDATHSTPLTAYLGELRTALGRLVEETDATIYLLNLPDISLLLKDAPDERKALVRGGVEQWNRVISQVATPHGNRVCLVDLLPHSAEILNNESGNSALANLIRQQISAGQQV